MKKIIFSKANVLLILLFITLTLMMIVLLKFKVSSIENDLSNSTPVKEVIVSKDDYKRDIFNILDDYDKLLGVIGINATSTVRQVVGSDDPIFSQIDDLKNKLIVIKVPSFEYKDLHMNLMVSLATIRDYVESPDGKKVIACVDSAKKVKMSRELLLD